MAIDREELSEAEDAIVHTLYELVSNLSGAEIGPLKAHMEARFPFLLGEPLAVESPAPAAPTPAPAPITQEPAALDETAEEPHAHL